MIKRIILSLMMVFGATLSSAQNVVIWKHVLIFSNDMFLPDSYISAKYSYRDNTLLYRLDYTDNGWQIIDSISYTKSDGLWYVTHFDDIEHIGFKLHYGHSDTTQNLHYTNDDIHYTIDKYEILSDYLDKINDLVLFCKKEPQYLKQVHISDTSCYSFRDVNHTLLFAWYGVSIQETLYTYCCHIKGNGEYDWDRFCFSECTITRRFEYDAQGDLCKVTVKRTGEVPEEDVTWVEHFILMEQ